MAEPPWAEGKTMSELAKMLSVAQVHLSIEHKQQHRYNRLVDLMGAITLCYLRSSDPLPREAWRPQIVADLSAVPYRKGCCTWRD